MSIYLKNLSPEINAQFVNGGIIFRKGLNSVDMSCHKVKQGYEMVFHFSSKVSTKVKAVNGEDIARKLPLAINEIFKLYTLKGMI